MDKKSILFLCTGNSCRSQMAEGWTRFFHNNIFSVYSAGIKKHGLNPYAVKVMQEEGIDITKHYSKTLSQISDVQFQYVVTVCKHAHENCPVFTGDAQVIHHGFDDPPFLTSDLTNEEEILKVYRRVRDEIRSYAKNIPVEL